MKVSDRTRCASRLLAVMAMIVGASFAASASAQQPAEGEENGVQVSQPTEAQLELNDRAVENIVEGNFARAVAQLEEAVLRGEFNILYLNLGRAYQKLGNCAKARQALEKAKTAPAVAEPAPKLVRIKADQYLAELDESCNDDAPPAGDKAGADRDDEAAENASDGVVQADRRVASGQSEAPSVGVRERNPNLFYLELGGHGGAPTINYERFFLFDYDLWGAEFDLGAGIGLGHTSGEINYGLWKDNGKLSALPVYASATFLGERHSLLVQSGLTLISARFERTGPLGEEGIEQTGGLFPFLQLGYQMHLDAGFLLRVSLTGAKYVGIRGGLSLGWSF